MIERPVRLRRRLASVLGAAALALAPTLLAGPSAAAATDRVSASGSATVSQRGAASPQDSRSAAEQGARQQEASDDWLQLQDVTSVLSSGDDLTAKVVVHNPTGETLSGARLLMRDSPWSTFSTRSSLVQWAAGSSPTVGHVSGTESVPDVRGGNSAFAAPTDTTTVPCFTHTVP